MATAAGLAAGQAVLESGGSIEDASRAAAVVAIKAGGDQGDAAAAAQKTEGRGVTRKLKDRVWEPARKEMEEAARRFKEEEDRLKREAGGEEADEKAPKDAKEAQEEPSHRWICLYQS